MATVKFKIVPFGQVHIEIGGETKAKPKQADSEQKKKQISYGVPQTTHRPLIEVQY